jgi:predicted  nucleic acid-binding Zn-ribbon protein
LYHREEPLVRQGNKVSTTRREEELKELKSEAEAPKKKLKEANEEIERLRKQVAELESKRPALYERQQAEELQVRSSMCFTSQFASSSGLPDDPLPIEALLITSMVPTDV